MERRLSGIDVLDPGQRHRGGDCGLALASLGADVVDVEPPWGADVRTGSDGQPPRYRYPNADERGITRDLASEAGMDVLRERPVYDEARTAEPGDRDAL